MTDQQRELYEERAAILIYDAGFTEQEAKRIARRQVMGVEVVKDSLTTGVERDLFGREISG